VHWSRQTSAERPMRFSTGDGRAITGQKAEAGRLRRKYDLAIMLQPFKYLTELQRHSPSLSRLPARLKAQVF
jgi:hypothetical protein